MKKVLKVLSVIAIFITFMGNICFADVVMTDEDARSHGISYENQKRNTVYEGLEELHDTGEIVKYVVIGALIIVIITCAVLIIINVAKNRKES